MSSYWGKYPEIENEIFKIKEFMISSINGAPNIIKEPIEKMIDAGGKMLRPALVVLGAKFGDYKSEKIIPVAGCIEMLHIATLIHDDIIDDASKRRGIKSTKEEYSKEVAVLIGDYLFAKTFDILADDYPTEVLKNLSTGIMNICTGELIQHSYRFKQDLEVDEYLRLISGKTASLFSMSLFAGAYQAKASVKIREALAESGFNMGVAFQIVDDCLDYNGNSELFGKSVLADLKDGYYTLPLLYALKLDKTGELKDITSKDDISIDDFKKIKKIVNDVGGVKMSKEKAGEYTTKAIRVLDLLENCIYKEILINIIDGLIFRNH
jgi:heptaprenyl diphosphate synthase